MYCEAVFSDSLLNRIDVTRPFLCLVMIPDFSRTFICFKIAGRDIIKLFFISVMVTGFVLTISIIFRLVGSDNA